MGTQGKNVSLARYNHTKTETMETVMNIFEQADNHSYTICFLGSRSKTIFEEKDGAQAPITPKKVEEIVEAIFDEFLASKSLKNLKIITNGATGGGIPEIVVKKFKEKREDKELKLDLEKQDKQIQLVAIVIYDEENPANYDYCIRVESKSAQIQAKINMSNLFIGLPGHTSTDLSTVIQTLPKDKEKRDYKVLLHTYWEKDFSKEKERVSFMEKKGRPKIILEQVPLKKNTPTKQKGKGFEGLKEAILDCLNKGLTKEDQRYNEEALLAINLDYTIENESNVEEYNIYYAESKFFNKEYTREHDFFLANILYNIGAKDIYGLTALPNGKLIKDLSLKDFKDNKRYKNNGTTYLTKYLFYKKGVDFLNIGFRRLASFLNEERYGQTLMWRYKRIGYGYDILRFSIMIIFNYQLPMVKINTIKRLLEDFLSDFSAEKMEEVFGKKNELLLKQATESSVSKLFVRNMTHNIVSHVLVHLQKKENLSEQGLNALIQKKNAYTNNVFLLPWEKEHRKIDSEDRENQMATIFNYISNRCYYLNEASYGIANTMGVKRIYNDIFRELDTNRILLNTISGIDDFKYTLRFVDENDRDLEASNDISVMLPGDTLGQQAFYNIIENIIRNEAKHGVKNDEMVNFIVRISNSKNKNIENINKYLKIEIYSDPSIDIEELKELLDKIKGKIDTLAFDKNYNLRSHSLGLLEMKVSAAFLRQIDLAYIDKIEWANILIPIKVKEKHLGYEFYVRKPEKYVFVFKEDNFLEEKNIESLENYGISFLKVEEFKKSIEKSQVYSHEFIFLQEGAQDKLGELGECFYKTHNDKQTNKKERVEALSLLPERLMLIEKDFAKKLIDSKDIEDFEKKVWEQWEGKEDEEIDRNTTKVNQNICQDTIRDTDIENGFNYDECRQVVFFDHLNNYRTWKNLTAGVNTSLVTIEPLSSAAQRKLPGFKNNLGEYVEEARKSPICQKLVEAYFNKVIVIDERIQRAAESIYPAKDGQGVKEAEIFNYINVLIPKKEEIDLAKEHFSNDDKNAIIAYIDNIKKAEFLVIHYGILERIYNNDTNRTEAINKQLNKWVRTTRVIVTSGRGRQTLEHLPLSVNYLNISSLLYAFVENRNKYSINYILNQSRR
jgi:hypothetical protein